VNRFLQEGRRIVTNLPLQMDVIQRDFPVADITFIDDLKTYDWDTVGHGVVLILDECWRLWPQGLKSSAIPHAQLALLKEHGHRSDDTGRSMDIVLITQDMADLCTTVRSLIETTFITAKHLDLGREDSFIRYTCRGACSLGKDNTPPKNQLISSENGKYNAKVYQYYRTHMHSQGDAAPNEKRIAGSSFFNSWISKAVCTVIALCIIAMIWSFQASKEKFNKMTGTPGRTVPTTTTTSTTSAKASNPSGQVKADSPPSPPPKPSYSSDWRIAGKLVGMDRPGMVVLMSLSGATRLISTDKCKREDFEDFCSVDGEIVTRFSGRQDANYLPDEKPVPVQVAAQ